MNMKEFMELTTKRCTLCDGEFNCQTTAGHDQLIFDCSSCKRTKAIFKNDKDKELMYFYVGLPTGHVSIYRAKKEHEFSINIISLRQGIDFKTTNVKQWFGSESRIKEKIDSLMVLK